MKTPPNNSVKNDIQDNVRSWLVKQGFALEMKTAEAFRKAGFEVTQSVGYVDPETGDNRETDVLAVFPDLFGDGVVGYCVECKGHPAPWMVFHDPHSATFRRMNFAVMSPMMGKMITTENRSAKLKHAHASLHEPGNNFGIRMMQEGKEKDVAHAASLSVVKACIANAQVSVDSEINLYRALIPAVVVNGPVFECWTADGEIQLREVNFTSYLFKSNLPKPISVHVWVVNFAHIDEFVLAADGLVETIWSTLPQEEIEKLAKEASEKQDAQNTY